MPPKPMSASESVSLHPIHYNCCQEWSYEIHCIMWLWSWIPPDDNEVAKKNTSSILGGVLTAPAGCSMQLLPVTTSELSWAYSGKECVDGAIPRAFWIFRGLAIIRSLESDCWCRALLLHCRNIVKSWEWLITNLKQGVKVKGPHWGM